jgi:hypothetical protein
MEMDQLAEAFPRGLSLFCLHKVKVAGTGKSPINPRRVAAELPGA